jgi:hypothetical protein
LAYLVWRVNYRRELFFVPLCWGSVGVLAAGMLADTMSVNRVADHRVVSDARVLFSRNEVVGRDGLAQLFLQLA